jgi:nitrogen fixation-related uncharacterized protein
VLQARAALRQYKDVMQAAERIFEGQFDDVQEEDEDMSMDVDIDRDSGANSRKKISRIAVRLI